MKLHIKSINPYKYYGGIIETQNDFTAPFGAIVEIENGQILLNN